MCVDTKVSLSMVDDEHLTIAGKTIREHYSALFHRFNYLADWSLNVNPLAKNFSRKLTMRGFTKATRDLSSDRPFQLSFHRL